MPPYCFHTPAMMFLIGLNSQRSPTLLVSVVNLQEELTYVKLASALHLCFLRYMFSGKYLTRNKSLLYSIIFQASLHYNAINYLYMCEQLYALVSLCMSVYICVYLCTCVHGCILVIMLFAGNRHISCSQYQYY